MSLRELDQYFETLKGPADYFRDFEENKRLDTHERVEIAAKRGITLRKQYEDIVTIESTVEGGVRVRANWPTPQSTLTISSKDIVNSDALRFKNVNCILTVYKRGFINPTTEFSLLPVLPMSVDPKRVDEIIEKTLQEDPWKF